MFHVEHFPNFLFLMALDIVQYKSGDPITAGTTYQIPGEMNSEAWILQSTTQGAVFQMTATAPTDEDWSNIQDTQFHINGTVTGLILPIMSNGYFRVVKEPVTEHATMALVEQEFHLELVDPINPFVAGTPVAPGYYDLSSLNLEAGKMYVLSVLPVQDKDYPETPGIVTDETFSAVIVGLTGTKATQVILRGVTTVGSHLFVMTGAKPILHLGGRSNVKFNITVSPVVFSAGSGDSLTPSSDATITGAWSFTNITVPTPTQAGQAANKSYVDNAVSGIGANFVTLDTEQTISGNKTFTGGIMKTGSPSAPSDLTNKLYVDGQIAPTVKNVGNQNVAGVKTFTDGVTMADEAPLTFGVGANAMKIHGSGTGAAVIEGANGTSLDVAVPTDFSEPITFQDTVSHPAPGTSETIFSSWSGDKASYELRYRGTDGALHLTKGGGESIFSCGFDGHMYSPYWFTATTFSVNGSSTLNAGVTMGQTLTVAGVTTLNNNLVLNPSNGGPTISASGGTVSWTQLGNTLAFRIQDTNAAILFSGSASSASVDIQKPDAQILTATSLMNQGESDGRYLKLAGGTVTGATTFNAGVTMAQSLNCSSTLQVASHLYVGDSIQTNTDLGKSTLASLKFQNTADSTEELQLLTDTGGVCIRIARENFYMASVDPDPTDVLSVKEMDARYAKIVTTTKAAYTALATKDPTTIYLITDTIPRMWAIGDMEIVTADMPA